MSHLHQYLFPAMWFIYLAYWWAKSSKVKETDRQESSLSRLVRLASMVGAIGLLWWPRLPVPLLERRCLPASEFWFWAGAVVTAGGLLFSVWGRHHLGKNWSQAVTLKRDHELITTGPYALVRHPIYTGFLLGFVGCAIALGEYRGMVAVALVFGALWHKLNLEERWIREEFGESHEVYCRRVAALVPYVV